MPPLFRDSTGGFMHRQIQNLMAFQADAVRDPRGWSQTLKMTAGRRESVKILTQLRPSVPLEFLFCDGTQHLFIAQVGDKHAILDGETDGLDALVTDYGRFTAEPHRRRILLDTPDGSRWQYDSKGWKVLKKVSSDPDVDLTLETPLLTHLCLGLIAQGFQAVVEGSQLMVHHGDQLMVVEASGLLVPVAQMETFEDALEEELEAV